MKLSTLEQIDLDKMNNSSFTMEEWQGFTVNSILAHLICATDIVEVRECLKDFSDNNEHD